MAAGSSLASVRSTVRKSQADNAVSHFVLIIAYVIASLKLLVIACVFLSATAAELSFGCTAESGRLNGNCMHLIGRLGGDHCTLWTIATVFNH